MHGERLCYDVVILLLLLRMIVEDGEFGWREK